MTKAKYATPEERKLATSQAARVQMIKQWQQYREDNGVSLGYFGGHRRVRTSRGPAKLHQCIECGTQAQHWAQIHETTGDDPEHYQPMCQKCHWVYDDVIARKNRTLTPEQRSALARKAWVTKRQKKARDDTAA